LIALTAVFLAVELFLIVTFFSLVVLFLLPAGRPRRFLGASVATVTGVVAGLFFSFISVILISFFWLFYIQFFVNYFTLFK
jgi:hypothetical protein